MKKVSLPNHRLPYLFERKHRYIYRRGIPASLRYLAQGHREFKVSLRTSDIGTAVAAYARVDRDVESKLARMREGKALEPTSAPSAAELREIASNLGVSYKAATDLTKDNDPRAIADRLAKWAQLGKPADSRFDALMGTQHDSVTISDVLSFYEKHNANQLIGMSQREIDKKRKPERRAIKLFQEFSGGDVRLDSIARSDALNYKLHLSDQISAEKIGANVANKRLMHIRKVITFYIEQNQLNQTNPFSNIGFNETTNARLPYSTKFIRERWLDDTALEGLNPQARGVLLAMLDTGCGGKELSGIAPDEIKLDDQVPHIIIQANANRKLKTAHRGRTIPLVGQALTAFQANPQGFPRYRTGAGADTLSNTLMKFLRGNELLETPAHTIYGIRHTFMDRMRVHEIPEALQKYLMGHKDPAISGHYGSGYNLFHKYQYLNKLTNDWK